MNIDGLRNEKYLGRGGRSVAVGRWRSLSLRDRYRMGAGVSLLVALLGAFLLMAPSASAHHPTVSATTACDVPGPGWVATFTSVSWQQTGGDDTGSANPHIDIYTRFRQGPDGPTTAWALVPWKQSYRYTQSNGFQFSDSIAVADLSKGDRIQFQARATAPWGNGYQGGQTTQSDFVPFPKGCGPVTTTTTAPPTTVPTTMPTTLPPTTKPVEHKVELCHATASHKNPYVRIDVDYHSVIHAGHGDHTGPIWHPGIEERWGDVIPPFDFGGDAVYPGMNWTDEGQVFFAGGCNAPEPPTTTVPPTTAPTTEAPTTTVPPTTAPPTTEPPPTTVPPTTAPPTTEPPTTVPPTTAPPTTEAPTTTEPPTTEPPTTTTPPTTEDTTPSTVIGGVTTTTAAPEETTTVPEPTTTTTAAVGDSSDSTVAGATVLGESETNEPPSSPAAVAPTATVGGQLPTTGADTFGMVLVAVALLAGGFCMVQANRPARRRS